MINASTETLKPSPGVTVLDNKTSTYHQTTTAETSTFDKRSTDNVDSNKRNIDQGDSNKRNTDNVDSNKTNLVPYKNSVGTRHVDTRSYVEVSGVVARLLDKLGVGGLDNLTRTDVEKKVLINKLIEIQVRKRKRFIITVI